jgi:hypothetical protein
MISSLSAHFCIVAKILILCYALQHDSRSSHFASALAVVCDTCSVVSICTTCNVQVFILNICAHVVQMKKAEMSRDVIIEPSHVLEDVEVKPYFRLVK